MHWLDPLNDCIMAIEKAGLTSLVYEGWNVINLSVVTFFLLVYRRHYGINRLKSLLIPALGYALCYLYILLLGWVSNGFQNFGSNNIVKGFCVFPLFGLFLSRLFKLEWSKVMDFVAPAFPLLQCVAHLACNFAGCCHGYPAEYGIWSPVWDAYLFPIQLLESLVALLVFVACLVYAKKKKYQAGGKVYPVFLILFGSTRFFLEFLRLDKKLFWGISDLALWAALMVIVGTAWLIAAKRNNHSKRKKKNP